MSKKPIQTIIFRNENTFATAGAMSTIVDPICIDDLKSFRLSLVSSATGAIGFNVEVASFNSHSDTNLSLWSLLPTTTIDFPSFVGACATDFPNCAVEVNTWRYLRVQAFTSATGVTAAVGSFKFFMTGERK